MIQGDVTLTLWESARALPEMTAFDIMNTARADGDMDISFRLQYDVYPNILQAAIVVDQLGPRIQGLLYPCMHPFHIRMTKDGDPQFLAKLATMPFPIVCKYCRRMMDELA